MKGKAKEILDIKNKLKIALNNKGITVGDKFSEYPEAINNYNPGSGDTIVVTNPFESLGYSQEDYNNIIGNDLSNQGDINWEYNSTDNSITLVTSNKDKVTYPPFKNLSEYDAIYNICNETANLKYVPKYYISGVKEINQCFNGLYVVDFATENKPDSSPKRLIESYNNLPYFSGDFGDLTFETYEPQPSTGNYTGSKAGGSSIFNNIGSLGSGISFGNISGMLSLPSGRTSSEYSFRYMQNVKSIGDVNLNLRYDGGGYLFANSNIESIGDITISYEETSPSDLFYSSTIGSIKSLNIAKDAPRCLMSATINSIGNINIEGNSTRLLQNASGKSWATPATIGDITVKGYVTDSSDYFLHRLGYIKSIGNIYMGNAMFLNSGNKIAYGEIQNIESITVRQRALTSNSSYCLLYSARVEKIGYIDIADENYDCTYIRIGVAAYMPCCTIKGVGYNENLINHWFKWSYWGDATGFRASALCPWKGSLEAVTTDEECRQSIVDSLLTYSKDRAAEGWATSTIYISTSALNLLTEEEIEAITAKGYTLIGE
jgi:hypothetical protein